METFKVPVLPVDKRVRNFSEVVVGLSKKQAVEHARLYLEREGADQGAGCALGTDIFGFLRFLAKGDIGHAFEVITQTNPFPSITGRLMSEPFGQIQVFSSKGDFVSVRQMERFVGDYHPPSPLSKRDKIKAAVAVIGSGPAGLAVADGLVRKGYRVTVFEMLPVFGGVLRYGYPEFRLPSGVVDRVIEDVRVCGVNFVANTFLGTTRTVEGLLAEGFEAVYVATGAGISRSLGVSGEDLPGVISAEEFLMKVNLQQAGREGADTELAIGPNVVVIGSGNAALDCARICVRFGASVKLVAKSTREDFAVRPYLAEHAAEEGVQFELLTHTVSFLSDQQGYLRAVQCRRLDYADTGNNEQWTLVEDPESDFEILADTVIVAVGHQANALAVRENSSISLTEDGRIQTREASCMTSVEGIFAGGNVVDGPGPLVKAILSSRQAVDEIDHFLQS